MQAYLAIPAAYLTIALGALWLHSGAALAGL